MKEFLETPIVSIGIRTAFILLMVGITNRLITKAFNRDKIRSMLHMKFIKNILKAIIWIIGITSIASQFSTFSKLANTILAGSGILAAVVGLAAQESFANILSGMFISLFRPFDVGDRVQIVGDDATTGFIEDITLRHTVIRTYMNARVIIPNSVMNSCKLINTTFTKGGSYKINVTIAYEDKEKRHKAKEILEDVVTNHPLFYDRRTEAEKEAGVKATEALCSNFGESGIDFSILMWTENIADNPKACSDCRMEILDRFEEAGIEIPYNKIVIVNNDTKESTNS